MPPQAVCNHVSSPFIGDVWVLAHVDDDLLEASLLLLRFSDVLADGVLALRNSNVLYLKASVEVGKSYDLQAPCLLVNGGDFVIDKQRTVSEQCRSNW